MTVEAQDIAHERSTALLIVNDLHRLNGVYRAPLVRALEGTGYQVRSLGFFETKFSPILTYAILLLRWRTPFVSSNLKTNILCMTLIGKRGLIILNGFGRMRSRWFARQLLLLMINLSIGKIFAIQSYADFRYLKRYVKRAELKWVPGSGGAKRDFGILSGLVAVQRDSKIELVASSLSEVINREQLRGNKSIAIVGCTNARLMAKLFDLSRVENIGPVSQSDILLYGSEFVQPDGYGEGLPHTLADALVSNMPILITTKQMVRFGLRRIGVQKVDLENGWCRAQPPYDVESKIGVDPITAIYTDLVSSLFNRRR